MLLTALVRDGVVVGSAESEIDLRNADLPLVPVLRFSSAKMDNQGGAA
jgi:hypothetical protein